MNVRLVMLLAAFAFASLLAPVPAPASAPPAAQAVLHQESRWLTALLNADPKTVASLLAENFVHITYQGKLLYREQEIASVKKEPFTMKWTEQTVDFAGDAAVVHGLNTISQSGKTVMKVRYTDVYVKQNGTWLALSSQESQIAQ